MSKKSITWSFVALITFLVVFLYSCSSGINYEKLPPGTDISTEISSVDSELTSAHEDQVDFYAPLSYKKAQELLISAKKARENNDKSEDILDDLAKAKSYLSVARNDSQKTKNALGEVVAARNDALLAEALKYGSARKVFEPAEDKLKSFSESVENGKAKDADKTRIELLSGYQEAELHAIEEKELGSARNEIDLARKEGAEELAPKNLTMAEQNYALAVATIKKDRHDNGNIAKAKQEADDFAHQVLVVTRAAKTTEQKKPEELAVESLTEKDRIESLRKQNTELAENARVSEVLKKVQARFSPSEAEIFEDGNKVHVRLIGLSFPVGKAIIKDTQFEILGKVEDALKDVKPEEVRIDGRTDSTGSKKVNKKLSLNRAKAIKEYLVANKAVEPSRVMVVGFDYEKPVASNKDKQGR